MHTASEIDRVFALQKARLWKLKKSTAAERRDRLIRLRDRLQGAGEEVADALFKDMARPKVAMPFDVQNAIDAAAEAIEKLDEWMSPTPVAPKSTDPGIRSYIHYEARGTVLIFGPWNFPFHLCVEPLISAIAAGNSVVIKPANTTPATSSVLAQIVRELFDESEVAIFEGDSALANHLLEKPFDHIFLTGSPKVGKLVMAAAAKNLASVTLELGGKNPAIIDRTGDIAAAAQALVTGWTMNAGQTCLSIDYVLVPANLSETLVNDMIRLLKQGFYQDDVFQPAKLGRFIDANNFWRVRGYIDEAVSLGATLAFGGTSNVNDLTMEPTILINVPSAAMIMHEEIFGPVTVVISYDQPEEAIEVIQRHGKPLGLMIFSQDKAFVQDIIQNTTSGGLSVNGWVEHYFDGRLPFGGVNASGIGRYHSVFGFQEFSHARAVFTRDTSAAKALNPSKRLKS
jgi:aldehyde dehydrogenase (NAD+)